jgi:hypothetical protein
MATWVEALRLLAVVGDQPDRGHGQAASGDAGSAVRRPTRTRLTAGPGLRRSSLAFGSRRHPNEVTGAGPGESLFWVWGWLRWPVPDAWGGRRQDRDHQHSGCNDESGGLGTKSLNEQAAEQRTNRQSPKCKE